MTQTITSYAGDSATYRFTVKQGGAAVNIANWKLAAEIWDTTHSLKKASLGITGGSDSQIKITDAANGIFEVYITKAETLNFEQTSFMEVANYCSGGKCTLVRVNLTFNTPHINWESK